MIVYAKKVRQQVPGVYSSEGHLLAEFKPIALTKLNGHFEFDFVCRKSNLKGYKRELEEPPAPEQPILPLADSTLPGSVKRKGNMDDQQHASKWLPHVALPGFPLSPPCRRLLTVLRPRLLTLDFDTLPDVYKLYFNTEYILLLL